MTPYQDKSARGHFKFFHFLTLACVFLLLAQGRSLFGQVDEGSVVGTVQDPTGAVVPNAHVTLKNKDVGLSLETTTNSSGDYIFSPVRIGNYSVSVTAPGFSTTNQENLQVAVSQRLQVNIQLKPGVSVIP